MLIKKSSEYIITLQPSAATLYKSKKSSFFKKIFLIYTIWLLTAVVAALLACSTSEGGDFTPPAEVSNLQAVAGDFNVGLSWGEPADADFAYAEITWSSVQGVSQPLKVNKGTDYTEITGLDGGTDIHLR